MNKKFISALLFGAMAIASTSTFVSCSYDDEITELRGDIAELATDLSSVIDQKMKSVDAEIAALRSQAEALDAAYKAADAALEKTIAAATNDAKGYADIQAAQAQAAAIAAAQELVEDAQAELEAALAAANNTISEQGKTINGLLEADKTLTSAVTAAQARADQAYTLAEQANKLATENAAAIEDVAEDLAAAQKSLGEAIEGLKATIAALDAQVKVLGEKVTALEAAAQKNAADIAAQAKTIEELKASNAKALEAAVSAAKSELLAEIEANAEEIEALEAEVAAAKAVAAAAVETAKAYTDAEVAKAKAEAIAASEAAAAAAAVAQAAADEAQETADAALAAAAQAAEDAAKAIEAAQATADKAVAAAADAAQAAADAQKAASDAQSAAIEAAIAEDAVLEQKFNASLDAVKDAYTAADAALAKDIKAINASIETINSAIDTVKKDLKTANENLVYESKRLKSLVFAPTEYVDGIECISFVTFKYEDWADKWEADKATTGKFYNIDDATNIVEYLVNPKNVIKSDIEELSYISNTATNTRALSEEAPVAVKKFEIENGVMKVTLDKTGTESFGDSRDKFTIISLKASLSDKFLTEEEIKNGEKAEVYSDWTRLYETSVTPRIHNALTNNADGTTNPNDTAAHFWNYTQAYDGKTKADALDRSGADGDGNDDWWIAKKVVYNKPVDLMTFVDVCDEKGKLYDYKKYGLSFEFHIMDYKLKNEGSTTDFTNQKYFAKLDDSILTSTARDNQTTNNRDAIGRQPMIQVVLKDDVNNKVVDVRYFKIKWVEDAPTPETIKVTDFGDFFIGERDYKCNDTIWSFVKEERVNALYASIKPFGLSRDEFHNTYALANGLCANIAEISKKNPGFETKWGTFVELEDNTGAGQTYNYKWTVNTAEQKMSLIEYGHGKKVVTAYGYFYNKTNSNERIAFKVQLTMKQDKIGLNSEVTVDQAMWKEGKRHINPVLESDTNFGTPSSYKTTQFIGSILAGYTNDGKTPYNVDEMVNSTMDVAKFVFDAEKVKKELGNGWSVSPDGGSLLKDQITAATVDPVKGEVRLFEDGNGSATSQPSKPALELVGKTVPVMIHTEWCDFIKQDFLHHDVKFLTPLAFESKDASVTLTDITAGGSSQATIKGKLMIREIFTTDKRLVWVNDPSNTSVVSGLKDWYGVEGVQYKTLEATTNIQKDGSINPYTQPSDCDTKLTQLLNSDNSVKYSVDVDPTSSNVTFYNMSGNAIGQEFKIVIPVEVNTKWQKGLKANIIVTIKPNI